MSGTCCFFIGHRDAPDTLLPVLKSAVEQHITDYHVTSFFVGHYGNFDSLAAQAVKEAKTRHPHVTLTLVLPYHPAERPIEAPTGFDGTYYPWTEHIPQRLAIIKTNRHMVDTCDYLIACARHSFGNSGQLVEYARKREAKDLLHITVLDPAQTYLELP